MRFFLCCTSTVLLLTQACADTSSQGDFAVLAARGGPSCELTEVVAPELLGASERGSFTNSGRLFVIGSRPEPEGDGLYWLVEITKSGSEYLAVNRLTGTLEGTADGTLDGEPVGDACGFSGMAVHGDILYLGCFGSDNRASLLRVDTQTNEVRAGAFTTCNFEPAQHPCAPFALYPNGMTVDEAGRIYTSNTQAHIGPAYSDFSVAQIEVEEGGEPGKLSFVFRPWLRKDLGDDGLAPNGLQVRDNVVYYAGGTNLNAIPIEANGTAGPLSVYYRGSPISLIDDFVIRDGYFVVAHALPSDLVAFEAPDGPRAGKEFLTCPMPALGAASSLTAQPELADPLFPVGTLVVTSFFGGGLYTLPPTR